MAGPQSVEVVDLSRSWAFALLWLAVFLAAVAVVGLLLGSRTVGLVGLVGCFVCMWPLLPGAQATRSNRRDK
jgi:hypothetical protein